MFFHRNPALDDCWLNLDWWADHPGGPFYESPSRIMMMWQSDHPLRLPNQGGAQQSTSPQIPSENQSVAPPGSSIVGKWVFTWDWGCYDGPNGPGGGDITFNNDGTFADGLKSQGTWKQERYMIRFQYESGAVYEGVIKSNTMEGTMPPREQTDQGGCWAAHKVTP